MADDRSITGSAATEDDVHDDDELAEVLAAELERYATGTVPVVPRPDPLQQAPMQPLAVPRAEAAEAGSGSEPSPSPPDESAFARRAAEVERAMRRTSRMPSPSAAPADTAADSFRRADRPTGRRSATGPIVQPTALPTADDLPVKRRSGFRPPPSAIDVPRQEPIDRVLPTGPVTLPEATASLLDSMISDATGPVAVVRGQQQARHAAPPTEPVQQASPQLGEPPHPAIPSVGDGLYDEWEQSLRAIGRPRAPWEEDDVLIPTGGDPDLPTVAIPVLRAGPPLSAPVQLPPVQLPPVQLPPDLAPQTGEPDARAGRRAAHVLPVEPALPVEPVGIVADIAHAQPVEPVAPIEPTRRRRSGRRRADVPDDLFTGPTPLLPPPDITDYVDSDYVDTDYVDTDYVDSAEFEILPVRSATEQEPADRLEIDGVDDDGIEDEGLDEVAVDYPVVSAATTGAIDLPHVEARPRTTPLFIERVRTAILQLPTVPSAPTGSGAGAIVGRWFGAFASPLTLVLAFGLAAAGSGSAAAVAVLAGALLAVPPIARTARWSARVTDDAAMQETAVLGAGVGPAVAVVLLLARIGAAATVLFLVGATAGAWVDRTGALGLGSSTAALIGCAGVGLLSLLCAALPARVTAVLTLLAAVLGAIGTLLVALVLAPTGGTAIVTTASGAVAGAVAGFVGIGLLVVLCGADIARWRTDIANPVSTAVGSAVAALCGAALVAAGTIIASRLSGGGDAVDEFAGALSGASASLLAAPLLVVLLVSAITLPAMLLRSSGAAAARLLGAGRPVRLGTLATGLLALAGALGLLSAGVDPIGAALAAAAIFGVPVAAWAGLVLVAPSARRPALTVLVLGIGVLVGWLLSDGILPGATSPVLDALALPASSGLRGGPALGVAVALVIGIVAGLLGGSRRSATARPVAGPADTVEG